MIDTDKVIQMFGGNTDLAQRCIDNFKAEASTSVPRLKELATSGEMEQLAITAHSFKSQLGFVALDDLQAIAAQIESLADADGGANEILRLIEELSTGLQKVI